LKLTFYVGPDVGLISDLRAKKMGPGDKPVADGAVAGLRLEPGNSKGQGGMIAKNVFVELWWLHREMKYENTY
jgi:hypothetical protein